MPGLKQILNIGMERPYKRQMICSAINQLRKMEFYYHGGYRTVEPFCLGIVMKGEADNESLICYQTSGFSDLGDGVGWKLYRASEMEDIRVLREKFTGNRPGFDLDYVEMARIICYVRPLWETEEAIKAPSGAPGIIPRTSPRYLTHNELMTRFRYAHPWRVAELDIMLWPEPLAKPSPERVELKIWPPGPVLQDTYPVGQTA
jgi:hypothetical protein